MMKDILKLNYFELASKTRTEIWGLLNASDAGRSSSEAAEIREEFGDNTIEFGEEKSLWKSIFEAYITPFTLVLVALAAISFLTDYALVPSLERELYTPIIIMIMVFLSGTMTLVQSLRSDRSVNQLESLIEVTSAVKRDGEFTEIRTEDIVLGDLVRLKAGAMIPADMRLMQTKDLFISQASLTGESYPVEKKAQAEVVDVTNDTSYEPLVFTGSEVVSGSAVGMVVRTGNGTLFGAVADELGEETLKTSFDVGIEKTSLLLIRFMAIMAPTVILVNGLTKGDWLQALLFGISVAVGLTPEMLPMIVTTNLVKGADDMAKEGTIIRNLNAIQNFGAIDVLVTDKTGTLTQDNIVLQYHLDIDGEESDRVLRHAYLNSLYQTGLGNLMDEAIIRMGQERLDMDQYTYTKVDEIPFDFERQPSFIMTTITTLGIVIGSIAPYTALGIALDLSPLRGTSGG